jgi:short-subunit dehydrogenase
MVFYPGYTETNFFSSEKQVGGSRRPSGKYMSPEKVAGLIIKCIEQNKTEAVFSNTGKLLKLLNKLFPKFVDFAMSKIAVQLRTY